MREQADAWLGFEPAELRRFARAAGLEDVRVTSIPARALRRRTGQAPAVAGDGGQKKAEQRGTKGKDEHG